MTRHSTRYGFAVLLLGFMLQACASGKQLVTAPADPRDLKSTYTLLLYGCHYPEDIKNLAVLVDEGTATPVEIYDLPTSYQVKKGLSGAQAIKEADAFVRCSVRQVSETRLRRIPDGGGTIGYEVRPLYSWLEFGEPDVLLVSYSLQKNGTVRMYIRLDPAVERTLESPGSDHRILHNPY